jgi:hypothetical protein
MSSRVHRTNRSKRLGNLDAQLASTFPELTTFSYHSGNQDVQFCRVLALHMQDSFVHDVKSCEQNCVMTSSDVVYVATQHRGRLTFGCQALRC